MSERSNIILKSALTLGVVIGGIGAGAGELIDVNNDADTNLTTAKENYQVAMADAAAQSDRLADFTGKLPSECLVFIKRYVEGDSVDVKNDAAVGDIVQEPGSPCSESRADVRSMLTTYRNLSDELAQEEQAAKDSFTDIGLAKDNAETDKSTRGWLRLGTIGLFLGGVIGVFEGKHFANTTGMRKK
jgi:hypothetical protein